jgi:hypothetical protein
LPKSIEAVNLTTRSMGSGLSEGSPVRGRQPAENGQDIGFIRRDAGSPQILSHLVGRIQVSLRISIVQLQLLLVWVLKGSQMPQPSVTWLSVVLRVGLGFLLGGIVGFIVGALVALVGSMTMSPTADVGSNIAAFVAMAVVGGTMLGILAGVIGGLYLALR